MRNGITGEGLYCRLMVRRGQKPIMKLLVGKEYNKPSPKRKEVKENETSTE